MDNPVSIISEEKRTLNTGFTRFILALILLLPGIFIYYQSQVAPALDMYTMSMHDPDLIQDNMEFVGMENYEYLMENVLFHEAVRYTTTILVTRLLIVAIVPVLVGVLVGAQGGIGRALNRLLLVVIGVLASPFILSILWSLFVSPIWGRESSPIFESLGSFALNQPETAKASILLLDGIITAGVAAAVGGMAFIAVWRGRGSGRSTVGATLGVWLLGILLIAASASQTFMLSYVITNGGPGNATTTVMTYYYRQAFMMLRLGPAAAEAVLLIGQAVATGILVWLVLTVMRLRVSYVARSPEGSSLVSIVSLPLITAIGLPIVGLVLWGVIQVNSVGMGSAERTLEEINFNEVVTRTLTQPMQAIWLIQIPIAYLIGLGLGFVRPINRLFSSFLFLLFLMAAFIPFESISIAHYMRAREMGNLNATGILQTPHMVGVFSLIVFKLFFDGAHERYNRAVNDGMTSGSALVQRVLLPSVGMVLLVGSVLSLGAASDLFWPLLAINSRDMFTLPVILMQMRGSMSDQASLLALIVPYVSLLVTIFVPVLTILSVVFVDKLAILSGTVEVNEPVKNEPQKPSSEFSI